MSEERRGTGMTTEKSDRDLKQAMNEMEETYEEVFGRPFFPVSLGTEPEVRSWSPATEIYDNMDYYIVLLELPGVNREDISVSATQDSVTVSGDRKQEEGISGANFTLCERCYGPFTRTLSFESAIDPDSVNAWLSNGILRLEIPMARMEGGRKIEISGEEERPMEQQPGMAKSYQTMRQRMAGRYESAPQPRMHTPGPPTKTTGTGRTPETFGHRMQGHDMKVAADMVDEASTGRLSIKDTIDTQEKIARMLTDSGRPLRNKNEPPDTRGGESHESVTREEKHIAGQNA